MFRLTVRTLGAAVLTLTLFLPLAGCDETGDLSGGSVEQQLTNARLARQAGNYEEAVRILEAAYAADPQSATVRAEYGVTLLERDDLNLLDLDRVATFVTSTAGGTVDAPASGARGAVCTFATDPTATPFNPQAVVGFPELAASRATIEQTLALLDPIIPDALQNFDLCTGFVDGPDGARLNYDRAAALAEMQAMGLTDAQISAALASDALARFLNAYLFLTLDLPQQTTWYRTDSGSGIGVCAADPDALLEQAREAVADLGEAAFAIDLRAATFGTSTTSQDLVELVADGYVEIRDGLGTYCTR